MKNIRTLESFLLREQIFQEGGLWLWKLFEMTGAKEIPWSVFMSIVRKCRSLSINDGDDVYYERDIDEESVSITKEEYGGKARWLTFMKQDNLTVPITEDATLTAKEGTGDLVPYELAFIFYFKTHEEVMEFFDGDVSWMPDGPFAAKLKRMARGKSAFGM